MRLLRIVAGAIVPHAPLLLPEIAGPEVVAAAETIRDAIGSISLEGADAIVLLTPHAATPGVYRAKKGDLSGFGISGVEVSVKSHARLAESLGLPFVDGPLDHGAVVPLRIGGWDVPVVTIGVREGMSIEPGSDIDVAVVASVNGSTGMSARAPLTEVPGAAQAQEDFVAALERDISVAARLFLPGSCGPSVLAAFADAFGDRRADVLAYEAPVGVGYVVAQVI